MAAKGKSSNPDLGACECDACGGFAAIRRQKTGKQYLYLHCPNCGMDKRSGAKLQAKWEKAIGQNAGENSAIESEIAQPLNTPQIPNEINAGEWMPVEVKQELERINNETKESETNERNSEFNSEKNSIGTSNGRPENGVGFFIIGALAGLAAVAGLRSA